MFAKREEGILVEITLQISNMLGMAAVAIAIQTAIAFALMIASAWISYFITTVLFTWAEGFFHQLIGYQAKSTGAVAGTNLNEPTLSVADNVLMNIIRSPIIWWIFLSVLAASVILLIFVTILSIIRSEMVFDEKSGNSKAEIYKNAFKAIAAFIAVPVVAFMGLLIANMLIAVIYNMLIGHVVLVESAVGKLDTTGASAEELANLAKAADMDNNIKAFVSSGTQKPLYNALLAPTERMVTELLKAAGGVSIVAWPIAYPLIAAGLIVAPMKMMMGAAVGVLIRMYNIILLFLLAPPVVSMMPLTKKPFDSWKQKFTGQVLGMYGVVIAVCIATILVVLITKQMEASFASAEDPDPEPKLDANEFSKAALTFAVAFAGVNSIKTMDGLVSGLFGAESSLSAGEGMAGQMVEGVKGGMNKMRSSFGSAWRVTEMGVAFKKAVKAKREYNKNQKKKTEGIAGDALENDANNANEEQAKKAKDQARADDLKKGENSEIAKLNKAAADKKKEAEDKKAEAEKLKEEAAGMKEGKAKDAKLEAAAKAGVAAKEAENEAANFETQSNAFGDDAAMKERRKANTKGKKYKKSKEQIDDMKNKAWDAACKEKDKKGKDNSDLLGYNYDKDTQTWTDKENNKVTDSDMLGTLDNLREKQKEKYNMLAAASLFGTSRRDKSALRKAGFDDAYVDSIERKGTGASNTQYKKLGLFSGEEKQDPVTVSETQTIKSKKKIIMSIMEEKIIEEKKEQAKAYRSLDKSHGDRRIAEAEAAALEQDKIQMVKVDGKNIVVHDRNRVELIKKGLGGQFKTYDREDVAKAFNFTNSKGEGDVIAMSDAAEKKVNNKTSGFNQAKGKLEAHVAAEENFKQIKRMYQFEQNTRMNMSLIGNALKTIVAGAGLDKTLGIKIDEKSAFEFLKVPEKIKKIIDQQGGKMAKDLEKTMLAAQKSSYGKKIERYMYAMEHPFIAETFGKNGI